MGTSEEIFGSGFGSGASRVVCGGVSTRSWIKSEVLSPVSQSYEARIVDLSYSPRTTTPVYHCI